MPTVASSSSRRSRTSFSIVVVLIVAAALAFAYFYSSKSSRHVQNLPSISTDTTEVASRDEISYKKSTSKTQTKIIGESIEGRAPDSHESHSIDDSGVNIYQPVSNSQTIPKESAPITVQSEPKLFDNQVENLLVSISVPNVKFGMVPQRINMSEEQVLEYLRKPVDLYEDDDEDTVAAKERTAAMKAEALKFIENGGTFDQFIRDNVSYANESAETVDDVRAEMKRILYEKGVDAAQAYLDEVNPSLKEQGLNEIRIRKGDVIMMERRKAREAAQQ